MEADHEQALIAAFVVPAKRARILELLSKPKRRRSALELLYHQAPLDARFMQRLPPGEQTVERIASILFARGAPAECYVVCTDPALDRTVVPLREALRKVVGQGKGTILSCVKGRLAYFEAEDRGERYLLERGPVRA